eukprot:Lankesteria_metandrocarpae@DN1_c0_g1_i1.p1
MSVGGISIIASEQLDREYMAAEDLHSASIESAQSAKHVAQMRVCVDSLKEALFEEQGNRVELERAFIEQQKSAELAGEIAKRNVVMEVASVAERARTTRNREGMLGEDLASKCRQIRSEEHATQRALKTYRYVAHTEMERASLWCEDVESSLYSLCRQTSTGCAMNSKKNLGIIMTSSLVINGCSVCVIRDTECLVSIEPEDESTILGVTSPTNAVVAHSDENGVIAQRPPPTVPNLRASSAAPHCKLNIQPHSIHKETQRREAECDEFSVMTEPISSVRRDDTNHCRSDDRSSDDRSSDDRSSDYRSSCADRSIIVLTEREKEYLSLSASRHADLVRLQEHLTRTEMQLDNDLCRSCDVMNLLSTLVCQILFFRT